MRIAGFALLWYLASATITILSGDDNKAYRGDTVAISWSVYPSKSDTVTAIQLLQGGTPIMDIAASIDASATSYNWVVPANLPNNYYSFRLVAGTSTDSSSFQIAAKPASITFTKPSGSEKYYRGQPMTISWATVGSISEVSIDLIVNSVVTTIASNVANTGTFVFSVPNNQITYDYCTLKITATKFDPVHDSTTSESSSFAVRVAPASLTITQPTSGNVYDGYQQRIMWTTVGDISKVDIAYRKDSVDYLIAQGYTNNGTFNWEVPISISPDYYYIRVYAKEMNIVHGDAPSAVYDESGSFGFKLEAASLSLDSIQSSSKRGETVAVSWTTSPRQDAVNKVKLEFLKNGGDADLTYYLPNVDGKFSWLVPSNLSLTRYHLRLTAVEYNPTGITAGAPQDIDSYGTTIDVRTFATLDMTAPTYGSKWKFGESQIITWACDPIAAVTTWRLLISTDSDGATVLYTHPQNVTNSGSYQLTVPNTLPTEKSLYVLLQALKFDPNYGDSVKVTSDYFSVVPAGDVTVTITSPASSTDWVRGEVYDVSFTVSVTPPSVTPVVQTFLLGLQKYSDPIRVLIPDGILNNGSFKYRVPDDAPLGSWKLVLQAVDYDVNYGTGIQGTADYLEIVAQKISIAVTKPERSSYLKKGTTQLFEWTVTPQGTQPLSAADAIGKFKVDVVSSGKIAFSAQDILGMGYNFTIPPAFPTGYYYFVVTATEWNHRYGDNAPSTGEAFSFTIQRQDASFSVLSPSSGTVAYLGGNITVNWQTLPSIAATPQVSLSMSMGSSADFPLTNGSVENTGTFNFKVPAGQPTGDYKVVITSTALGAEYTDSSVTSIVKESSWFKLQKREASFSILSPEYGATAYRGGNITVNWQTLPDRAVAPQVKLSLFDSYTEFPMTTDAIDNTGSFTYKVPINQLTGDYYKVRITSAVLLPEYSDSATTSISAQSQSFKIQKKPASFSILSPAEGANAYIGGNFTVSWQTLPMHAAAPKVTISFVKSGTEYKMTASPIDNTGSYTFEVPLDQPVGTDYKVMVASAELLPEYTDGSTTSISQQTRLTLQKQPASFTIEEPKKDEQWNKTTASSIEWTTTGVIPKVRIELLENTYNGDRVATLVDNLDNTGIYFWTVPVDIALDKDWHNVEQPTKFKLRITAVPGTYSAKYEVTDGLQEIVIGPKADLPYVPNLPEWNPSCPGKRGCLQLVGDAFCACMRDCGRRCVPGYKYLFSGFDAIANDLRGFVLQPEFDVDAAGAVWSASIAASHYDFYVPLGVTVQQEASLTVKSSTSTVSDYSSVTHDEQMSYSSSFDAAEKLTGAVDAEYSDLFTAVKENKETIFEWTYKNPTYKLLLQGKPRLDSYFNASLFRLPRTYDSDETKKQYRQAIDLYGYEYPQVALVGQRVQTRTRVQKCYARTTTENSLKATVEFEGKTESGAGNDTTTGGTKQGGSNSDIDNTDIECLREYATSTISVKGGLIEALNCGVNKQTNNFECNGNWNAYQQTKYENPYRLELTLVPIADLIEDSVIKANWKQAVVDYHSEQQKKFEVSWPAPTPSNPAPCACDKKVDDDTDDHAATPDEKDSKKKSFGGYVALGVIGGLVALASPFLKKAKNFIQEKRNKKSEQELQDHAQV
eukprot:TRINITY_DN3190_c0_g1_i1.p1 TRINITY_DN3190_c0_g1~~TRINITY_DN3190_c0_g1_i1.p1  ORF type:complete len:1633 (+),score=295.73 TRINITY_DN3190_c0_g1_i1:26-4900(+)